MLGTQWLSNSTDLCTVKFRAQIYTKYFEG